MTAPARAVRLRLPATSANLGPAFDTAGLALSLFLEITAELAPDFTIDALGRDAHLTGATADNLILMTYREVLGSLGLAAPALHLTVTNGIPLGMGCGSSAAAICAGVLLASHFGGLHWSLQQVLDEAARREGHPDNVAAALLGGMTVARTIPVEDGRSTRTLAATFSAVDLPLRAILALPPASLSTSTARALLPPTYPRADIVHNLQNTALLVAAFAQGRPELLRAATGDRLHQPFRLPVCPLLGRLLPLAAHPAVYSVTLSGAGPSVLLLGSPDLLPAHVAEAAGDLAHEVLEVSILPPTSSLTDLLQ